MSGRERPGARGSRYSEVPCLGSGLQGSFTVRFHVGKGEGLGLGGPCTGGPMSGKPGPGVPCMVRPNASWVMVKWGPLLQTDIHRRLKTLSSRNFVGGW